MTGCEAASTENQKEAATSKWRRHIQPPVIPSLPPFHLQLTRSPLASSGILRLSGLGIDIGLRQRMTRSIAFIDMDFTRLELYEPKLVSDALRNAEFSSAWIDQSIRIDFF
jgi:hypothetical protein